MSSRKTRSKALIMVSKANTKKGRLKGRNKKETKLLKSVCPHQKQKKNGEIKSMIDVQDGMCVCMMCGVKFPASLYSNKDMDEIVDSFREMNDQAKYLAHATNAGTKMCDYFCEMGANISHFKKNAKKVRNVADRQSNVKKKKKNNRSGYGSSQYGNWGHTRK